MHPGLQRGNADRRVLVMRRSNDDRVHFARRDQFLSAVEDFQSFGFVRLEFLRRGAANSDEFATRHFALEQIAGVMFADIAHADDAKTNFVHASSKKDYFRFLFPVNSSASAPASYTLRSASIIDCEQTETARACLSV